MAHLHLFGSSEPLATLRPAHVLRLLSGSYVEWFRLFRRSWYSATVAIASQSLATASVALASHGLGAQGYGEVVAIGAYYGWFSLISSYTTHALLPRLAADPDASQEDKARACSTTFWLSMALVLVALALAVPLLPFGLRQLGVEMLQSEALVYAALVALGQASGVIVTISQAAGWLRLWSAVGLISGLLPVGALLGYQFVANHLQPMTYLLLCLACSLVATGVAWALFMHALGSWRFLKPDTKLVGPMLRAGRGPWIANVSSVLASFGTSSIIAVHLTKSDLGHYDAVLSLHMWINMVGLSVAVPALSDWSRIASRRDFTAMRADVRRRQLSTAAIFGAATVVALLFAEPILRTLYGPEFVAAAPVLRVLSLAWVFNGLGGWYWYFMFATGEAWRVAPANVAFGVPTFAIAYLLLTFTGLGIMGPPIARATGIVLWFGVYEWHFRAAIKRLQAMNPPARGSA